MSYRTIPPKQIPGNGLHLGTCVICGKPFYRNNRFAESALVCSSKCRAALVRKRKDADPNLPQYTCAKCTRVYRSAATVIARCPKCNTQQRVHAL